MQMPMAEIDGHVPFLQCLWMELLFMAPALLLVVGLLLTPVAWNRWLSFASWKKFTGFGEFGGFDNYSKMAANPYFTDAPVNTAIWVASDADSAG